MFRYAQTLAAAASLLAACSSGGGDPAPPAANVTATWIGTWTSSNSGGGSVNFSFTQNGSAVSGSGSLGGSSCFSGGAVAGTVSGVNFNGALTAGGIRVDFAATVTGAATLDQMNGTYNVVSGGACTGDTGTISLSRSAPLTVDPPLTDMWVIDEAGNVTVERVRISDTSK